LGVTVTNLESEPVSTKQKQIKSRRQFLDIHIGVTPKVAGDSFEKQFLGKNPHGCRKQRSIILLS
jgi:hypothetical protein